QRLEVDHNTSLQAPGSRGADSAFDSGNSIAHEAQLYRAHGIRVFVEVPQNLILFIGKLLIFRVEAEIKLLGAETRQIAFEQEQRFVSRGWRRKPQDRSRAVRIPQLLQSRIDRANRLLPRDRRLNSVAALHHWTRNPLSL